MFTGMISEAVTNSHVSMCKTVDRNRSSLFIQPEFIQNRDERCRGSLWNVYL